MRKIQTEILVIGGGATGTGILRDLAMRGFQCLLVEKGDLTHGTTGRYHGLLHSGGRYVVKDPQAAKECIEENLILRRIMPHCIEDTGGYFVLTPWDNPEYAQRFMAGINCWNQHKKSQSQKCCAGTLLNPQISRCFHVPDWLRFFLAADANIDSAREYGAQVLRYHKVEHLLLLNNQVKGALCHDLVLDEQVEISADLVVNASGAWAGQIAAMAGCQVSVVPGKGTMLAMNHRLVHTVINRCKIPSDGDILVPAHTVSVIGTTDVKVSDPDHYSIEAWEIKLMLEEGEKLLPGFKDMRVLRAWAGVRPLYQESKVNDTRDITRAFVLLDHENRDGIAGLVTITSGKWTTYRKMAESTVDLVCQKIGVQRACRTHLESLPSATEHGYHQLGRRLEEIEKARAFGKLVCECELATYEDVASAIIDGGAQTIDDIRRDVRLGMGPCQGGFCTYRVAGILQKLRQPKVEKINLMLREFLEERWKGLFPILWGQQLRQERLDELIYLSILNADQLPGPQTSLLSPEPYLPGIPSSKIESAIKVNEAETQLPLTSTGQIPDLLVIGMGLAGLSAAWSAGKNDQRVKVIAKGGGTLYWHTGCIDIIGYLPSEPGRLVKSPAEALPALCSQIPEHPYAILGQQALEEAVHAFLELCRQKGLPYDGSLDSNWLLPSAVGTGRPTCLAPASMLAGDMESKKPTMIFGFSGFPDFYPDWIAANLAVNNIPAESDLLDLPSLRNRTFITSRVLAELFDKPDFVEETIQAVKLSMHNRPSFVAKRIGFPAVLGIKHCEQVIQKLRDALSVEIFEIPTLPPSIPGIRLHHLLVDTIQEHGGRVYDGMQVIRADWDAQGNITQVWSEAASRGKPHRATNYLLATGGLLGGGLFASYEHGLQEMIFNLPIQSPGEHDGWFQKRFLSAQAHPIYSKGILVDSELHPLNSKHSNLRVAGATLAGGDFIRQRALDGVALVSGYYAGQQIGKHKYDGDK